MTSDYQPINIGNVSELQELVRQVQQSKKARTVRLADDVVAVVKPEPKPAPQRTKRRQSSAALSPLTIEQVFGSVPTPPHLHGKDIDEMIREAKDEHTERFFTQH